MTKILSKSLTSEFIRLDGLQRLTNVTAHDWDIYIFKELVDNALDADEADPNISVPHIRVVISYENINNAGNRRLLSVKVTNQSRFPLEHIEDIFDFEKRASVKSHYSNPTRGAQGNALKTILGIPYALHNHYSSDFELDRVPLSIRYGGQQVVVKLKVDELYEQVALRATYDVDDEPEQLTTIQVNIGQFLQESRTIGQLMSVAQAFILFNPHANFDFEFIFNSGANKPIQKTLQSKGRSDWHGRYNHDQPAPIHWYGLNKFKQLVSALWRTKQESVDFQLIDILGEFGITKCPDTQEFSDTTPVSEFIYQKKALRSLHELLCTEHQMTQAVYLGEIGRRHITDYSNIANSPVDQSPLFFYRKYSTSDPMSNHPFTLEVVLYANQEDRRRVITGINHTTTYADPFFNKPLMPPSAIEPTRSLEKLLDHYSLREDMGITLILHLIAPNILYENYGKSAISDEPYRHILTELVDEITQEYWEAIRPPDPIDYLSEPAYQLLPNIIKHLEGKQFTERQLLYEIKRRLTELTDPNIVSDLRSSNADSRIQDVITTLHRETSVIGLIRRQSGRLAVPRHDKDTINIAFGDVSIIDVVQQFHIRAIIITNNPSIEEILISSRYTLRYDIGILRSDNNLPAAIDLLARKYKNILANSNAEDDVLLPQIWIVRDATPEAIRQTRTEISTTFQRYKMEFPPIYDLGLHPAEANRFSWIDYQSHEDTSPIDRSQFHNHDESAFYAEQFASAQLESLTPYDLETWFKEQLDKNQLPLKALPDTNRLMNYAIEKIRRGFQSTIAELAFEEYGLDEIQEKLTDIWRTDKPTWNTELYNELQAYLIQNPHESWSTGLDTTIQNLLRIFLKEKHSVIKKWIQG